MSARLLFRIKVGRAGSRGKRFFRDEGAAASSVARYFARALPHGAPREIFSLLLESPSEADALDFARIDFLDGHNVILEVSKAVLIGR